VDSTPRATDRREVASMKTRVLFSCAAVLLLALLGYLS
jgi:hypothetical protein